RAGREGSSLEAGPTLSAAGYSSLDEIRLQCRQRKRIDGPPSHHCDRRSPSTPTHCLCHPTRSHEATVDCHRVERNRSDGRPILSVEIRTYIRRRTHSRQRREKDLLSPWGDRR